MAAADRRVRQLRHQTLTPQTLPRRERRCGALLAALVATLAAGRAPAAPGPLRYPLDHPPRVSATFGTYRIGHHHAGMDLTTDGDATVPVVAAAAGQIVRIRRNHVGYGRAVYINHPDKRQTVYAHLAAFDPRLAAAEREAEARAGAYPFDHRLREPIPVAAGDRLGWIGTSGTDLLHLHFEVRRGGQPVNPLLDGLTLPDRQRPAVRRLLAVPRAPDAHVADQLGERMYVFAADGTLPAPVVIGGDVQLLVEAVDFIDGLSRAVTPFEVELRVDGRRWHRSRYDRASYRDRGHTELDFEPGLRARGEGMFHKLVADTDGPAVRAHQPAGKPLTALARGIHPAEIIARDAAGNQTTARFRLDVRPLAPPCAPKTRALGDGPPGDHAPIVLRDRLLVIPAPGLCDDGARHDLRVDGKKARPGRAVVSRLDDTPAIALTVDGEAPVAVDLRLKTSDGTRRWQVDTLAAPAGKEASAGPIQLTVGKDARFWPYPTRLEAVRDNPGASGLVAITPLYRLANGWVPTKGGSTLGVRVPAGAPATSAMYFHEDGHWWWMGRGRRGPWMRGWTVHMGEVAIMADGEPPWIGPPRVEQHPAGPRLVVPVEDDGSGLRRVELRLDGAPVLAEQQRAWGRMIWLPLEALAPGPHRVETIATDRVGHATRAAATISWPAAAAPPPVPPTPANPTEATPRDGIGDGIR
ncbi:MAG: M23 family metallopeptidase [bacterium]